MLKSQFIEDDFLKFYQELLQNFWQVPAKEADALSSFYMLCVDNRAFTEKQASYMLTLMAKYQEAICNKDFDFSEKLANPKFKHPFRIIDDNKKFYIEKTADGTVLMCFKFPYAFKAIFDKEVTQLTDNKSAFRFDLESQARKINFYDLNPVVAYEFALTHNFEIDESVLHAVAETETAWSNQEQLTPKADLVDNIVTIRARNEHCVDFFNAAVTGDYLTDLFTAKSMGYPAVLDHAPEHIVEKIAVEKTNTFWIQTNAKLFELYKTLGCKIAIILDRNDNNRDWIKNFTQQAEEAKIKRSEIKVCFRDNSEHGKEFNEWIKRHNHGGKVDKGNIYIFDHKPAKWLFKEPNFVKIVVTTTKFMPSAPITKELINTHPCAIYLSDIKPTVKGNTQLVKL
jgi:hypothetical protein